jgi:hypothetical protein
MSEDRPYKNVPDSLMGFRKSGENKSFHESNYPHTQAVRVEHSDGDKFVDAIKGMNKSHAMERAWRNWPTASHIHPLDEVKITPVDHDPFSG